VSTIKTGFAMIPAKAATAKLSATDWAVLHVIGLHADKAGKAFPSMARIAEIIGIKRGDVPRSLNRLEKRGLLSRERVPRPKGGWQVNHYQMLYEPLEDVRNTADRDVRSTTDTPGVRSTTDTCPQHNRQGVRSDAALTNHLTIQVTEAYQEEVGKVEGVNDGGVRNTPDIPPERCRWPLGAGCDRAAVTGTGMCARHG
jgi:predicted transcriptional regulator